MTNRKTLISIGLGAVLIFSSSKKENRTNDYSDGMSHLLEMTQINGKKIEADSLKGRMVVLNFWASYDPTSRINNYDLLTLKNKFKDSKFHNAEGVEVVSISLDIFNSPLRKAITTDATQEFIHICDFKGIESPIAESFDVNRPVNLLMDTEGNIIARDFGTNTLSNALERIAE